MKYNYFEIPTQVKFWDGRYIDGIAYQDELICGCCGTTFRISENYEPAPDALEEDPIIRVGWKSIKHKIRGEE